MGNEIAYLSKMSADMQYLKALMGRIAAASALASTSYPTIDFAVDMFDRSDSGTLNGYWTDTAANWTLRSGKVICQATSLPSANTTGAFATTIARAGTGSGATYNTGIANRINAVMTESTFGSSTVTKPTAANLYAGTFSTKDLSIKITFDMVQAIAGASSAGGNFEGTSVTTNQTFNQTSAIGLTNTAGVAFGNTAGRQLMAVTKYCSFPDLVATAIALSDNGFDGAHPGTCSIGAATLPAFNAFLGQFGDLSSLIAALPGSSGGAVPTPGAAVATGTGTFLGSSSVAFSALSTAVNGTPLINLVVGSNTLQMDAVGNVYTVTLNGVVLYTTTTAFMIDRSRAGITGYAVNVLGGILQNSLGYSGITSFKAWPYGLAEPAAQTGRGTYVSGNLSYNDRYHTTASNGTVTYNPLA